MKKTAVIFDFDSTIVSKESLDEAIATALENHQDKFSIMQEIEHITRQGMEGTLDFKDSVRSRLAVAPITKTILEKVGTELVSHTTEGMHDVFAWLREHGHDIYIISGGFPECIIATARALSVPDSNIFSNRMTFTLDGGFDSIDESSLLWTNEGKTPVINELRKSLPDHTIIMIGDGMNDYRAYESGAADDFVGFGAHVVRKSVEEKAPHFVHSAQELLAFLKSRL